MHSIVKNIKTEQIENRMQTKCDDQTRCDSQRQQVILHGENCHNKREVCQRQPTNPVCQLNIRKRNQQLHQKILFAARCR